MEGWPGAKGHAGRFLNWDATLLQGHGPRVRCRSQAPRGLTGESCRHCYSCKLQKTPCCVLFRHMLTFLKFENKGTDFRIISDLQFPNRTFLSIKEEKIFHQLLGFGNLQIKLTQERLPREKTSLFTSLCGSLQRKWSKEVVEIRSPMPQGYILDPFRSHIQIL